MVSNWKFGGYGVCSWLSLVMLVDFYVFRYFSHPSGFS